MNTIMISEKLQNAINEQISAEMWSSNLYLSMSFYFEREGFSGFAHWMKKQSQEEMGHAYAMADYIIKRGGIAKVDKIDVVPTGWGTPLEVFEHVFEHERHVSKLVDALVDIAAAEKDKATQDFLWGFVREQVEARYLSEIRKPMWIRRVLVPGLTDDPAELQQLKDFIDSLSSVEKVEILPYHTLGLFKWQNLGIEYPLEGVPVPTPEQVQQAETILGIAK